MSSNSSSFSSLKTDSDCDSSDDIPPKRYPTKTTQIKHSKKSAEYEDFSTQMLKQIYNEVHNQPESSSSLDFSSNELLEDNIIENDSFIRPDKIAQVNNLLAKNYIQALMAYKASSRPVLNSISSRRKAVILSSDLVSTIEPVQGSTDEIIKPKTKGESSGIQKNRELIKSLKKINELTKIRQKSVDYHKSQIKDIKLVDQERNQLKLKLDELSCSLDTFINERKNVENHCSCIIY